MGCLRGLLVRIGCLATLVALLVGWIYRHEIVDFVHSWRPVPAEVYVAPDSGGAARARDAFDRLGRGGGPAYVDLSAAQVAALVEEAVAAGGGRKRVFDSVRVALLEGEVRVRGVLDLSGVPRNLLGPLSSAIGDRERATIGGPLSVDSNGHLVLTVSYLKLRDFPFPRSTIPRLLEASRIPGVRGARVRLPTAAGGELGDVRVTPAHVRFYRRTP
jgi:hypothetical protein